MRPLRRGYLFLVGSPASGKTMLVRRLATLLPALTLPEALAVTISGSAIDRDSTRCFLAHERGDTPGRG
jgi:predicted ATPase with chaperone activity